MRIGYFFLILLIFASALFSLSACGMLPVSDMSVVRTLPAPRAVIIHEPTPGAVYSLPPATLQPNMDAPEDPASMPSSLAELARQVHGDRLIEWIEIPALNILAPVTPVGWKPVADALDENMPVNWDSPDASVGWVVSSGLPGDNGNILLYGHNNIHASVFVKLSELKPGDQIYLRTKEREWIYLVSETRILPVLTGEQDFKAYQDYFQPTRDERLTLLSCWPPIGNSHRVIIIALPDVEE